MGQGSFDIANGKFTLHLSLRYEVPPDQIQAELAPWQAAFNRASQMLYNATAGQMQFGTIYVSNTSAGAEEADAWLYPEGQLMSFVAAGHVTIPEAFGTPGIHMSLANSEKRSPFNVLHEFGHYGLGLGDEYKGVQPGTNIVTETLRCEAKAASAACIMGMPLMFRGQLVSGDSIDEHGVLTKGWVRAFCNDDNHEAHAPSFHNAIHRLPDETGKSCASVIAELYGGMQVPKSVDKDDLAGHEAIELIVAGSVPFFSLAYDASTTSDDGTLEEGGGIDGVIESAHYWAESGQDAGDSVSVFAFGPEAPAFVDALGPTHDSVDEPSIRAGIQAARTAIAEAGDRAATQAIILFSTGKESSPPPEGLGRALIRDGIRAFLVGLGSDRQRLHRLAELSGGEYYEVTAHRGPRAIRDHLMSLADRLRLGSPILEVSSGAVGNNEHRVRVEKGAQRVKLVLSHEAGIDMDVSVARPDGRIATPEDEDLSVIRTPARGYQALSIHGPDAGDWVVRVDPPAHGAADSFSLCAYSENPSVHIGVSGARRLYALDEEVTLHVVVSGPVPVTGLAEPTAKVTSPTGEEKLVTFAPDLQGVYVGSFDADEVGPFEVQLEVRNDGGAAPASLRTPADDSWKDALEIPEFQRVKRFQVHVGEPEDSQ